MKLIYRGNTYDYSSLGNSNPDRRVVPHDLRYRGVTYRVTPKSEFPRYPTQTITHQLIYRGNTYRVTRSIAFSERIHDNHAEQLH
jgi:hypothetical protein